MTNKIVMKIFPRLHSLVYRCSEGRLGSTTGGFPNLLLITIGRRSGKERTAILCYVRDGADYIVAGSNGGLDKEPYWVHNLRYNPAAKIVIGNKRMSVVAEEIKESNSGDYWKKMAECGSSFEDFQKKTNRRFPLFLLRKKDMRN